MKRYYFDYAAATPVDPAVEKAMRPYWSGVFGNPGAIHWFGQEASAAVFRAREQAAKALNCGYKEIIFTSGATEANNLAIRGIVRSWKLEVGRSAQPKIIVSAVEHESILETAKDLEKEGVEVIYLPVDKNGIVDLEKLKKSLDERTVLVSVMYANNEVGTIQPISEIAELIRNFRKVKSQKLKVKSPEIEYPLFHTDAVQALNYLDCDVNKLGADLLTLSSQKIYGPKGAGMLYARSKKLDVRRNALDVQHPTSNIQPIITGGGQEYGLRGGTENVPAIVGFGKAMEIALQAREAEAKRLNLLKDYFLKSIRKISSKVLLNGGEKNRLPNNLNFYFPGKEAGDLVMRLDLLGFAVSPGSACMARVCQPSHVLKALGYSDERASGSLRITFGRPTAQKDLDQLLLALKKVVK